MGGIVPFMGIACMQSPQLICNPPYQFMDMQHGGDCSFHGDCLHAIPPVNMQPPLSIHGHAAWGGLFLSSGLLACNPPSQLNEMQPMQNSPPRPYPAMEHASFSCHNGQLELKAPQAPQAEDYNCIISCGVRLLRGQEEYKDRDQDDDHHDADDHHDDDVHHHAFDNDHACTEHDEHDSLIQEGRNENSIWSRLLCGLCHYKEQKEQEEEHDKQDELRQAHGATFGDLWWDCCGVCDPDGDTDEGTVTDGEDMPPAAAFWCAPCHLHVQ